MSVRKKRRYDESESGNRNKRRKREDESKDEEDIVELNTLTIGEKRKRNISGTELGEKRRKRELEENGVDHNYTERNAILRSAYFEGRFKREMQKRQREEHSGGVTKMDDGDDNDL